MARPLTSELARTLRPPPTVVRQSSAAQFPRRTPTGGTQALTLPEASNQGLWYWWFNSPEVFAVANRIGNGVSRVAFMPCVFTPGAPGDQLAPVINQEGELADGIPDRLARDCAEIWAEVQSPSGPQSEIFTQLAVSLSIAGDAWQFGWNCTDDLAYDPNAPIGWMGLARPAIEKLADQFMVNVGAQTPIRVPYSVDGGPGGTAIRVFNPDPSAPAMATSWITSVLPHLQQLEALYEAAAASALSRMNAGVILAPDDQDQLPIPAAAVTPQTTLPVNDPLNQSLYDEIADHVQATQDEGLNGFSRVVPAVIGMNSALTDKVKWLELSRAIDPGIRDLVQELRYELTIAAPTPPELILGLGQTNHWNGEQIDEDEYQSAILPVCERIAYSNTRYVLREGLKDRGWGQAEVDRVCIGFTARYLLTPPDRTEPAIKIAALDRPDPVLSPAELRELAGMGEYAGPDDDETFRSEVLWLAAKNSAYGEYLELIGFPPLTAPEMPAVEAPVDTEDEPTIDIEPPDDAETRQAAALPASADADLGVRLVDIATRYEEQLATLFAAIIARMSERASTRVASLARSKWSKTPELRSAVADAKPSMVGMVPGVLAKLRAESIDDGDLFEPALAFGADAFVNLTRKAQRAAIQDAGADWEQFATDANEATMAAWAVAGTLLTREARRKFEGRLPGDEAETSADSFRPPSSIIRRVSAVAGGDMDVNMSPDARQEAPSPLASVATALLARRALEVAGRTVTAWIWDYRPEIARGTFIEHFDLHGSVESGGTPGDFGGYFPGDHYGCECVLRPVTALGEIGDEEI